MDRSGFERARAHGWGRVILASAFAIGLLALPGANVLAKDHDDATRCQVSLLAAEAESAKATTCLEATPDAVTAVAVPSGFTESVAIGESAEIRIGVFRMEVRKETPTASVQF